jgi:hypothetical protein
MGIIKEIIYIHRRITLLSLLKFSSIKISPATDIGIKKKGPI